MLAVAAVVLPQALLELLTVLEVRLDGVEVTTARVPKIKRFPKKMGTYSM